MAEKPEATLSESDFFVAISYLTSLRSKDPKTQVGACIVSQADSTSPPDVVALGYNGTPNGPGFKDKECKWGKKATFECHAELNAIISGYRRLADLSSCKLYLTHSPCKECCKLILQSRIPEVEWDQPFMKEKAAKDYLSKKAKRKCEPSEDKCVWINLSDNAVNFKKPKTIFERKKRAPTCETCKTELTCTTCKTQTVIGGPRDVDLPLDDYFMALALLASSRSPQSDKDKVGACLVFEEPRRLLSLGCKGPPDGRDGRDGPPDGQDGQDGRPKLECCAESNAIMSAYRQHADLTSCTLYTTGSPCDKCCKMIVQSGIKVVVCGKKGRDKSPESAPVDILNRAKITVCDYIPHTNNPVIIINLKEHKAEQYISIEKDLKKKQKDLTQKLNDLKKKHGLKKKHHEKHDNKHKFRRYSC